ncbi:hypothetical protein SDC9_169618 [bioreactor metagenome]|uniref:Uncharacterized protein n=1 Tax=bioreactor metagenome TaxID=1076179 RepID=A0A645G6H0_9ZZZZ
MLAIAVSGPMVLNTNAMNDPPTKTENITFQLAMPVANNTAAPSKIAITLVSPIEPGIKPVTMSHEKAG